MVARVQLKEPMTVRRTPPVLSPGAAPTGETTGWQADRAARLVATGSVAALAGAVLAGPALRSSGPVLLVVAGLLGLPHGAVDHVVLRLGSAAAARRALAGYAAAAVGATAVAVLAPVPAVLGLLVLSVLHFAEGERGFARLRGQRLPAATATALAAAVVALPLLLRPGQARPLLAALAPALPGVLAVVRLPVLVATAGLVVVGLAAAARSGDRRGAAELGVVVAAAAAGPALVVFATWFACWHAPRHLVRVAAHSPGGTGRERAGRLARAAAGPTVLAVLGLAALALRLGGLPSAVLVVLLGLTVPHAAVVAGMEERLLRGA